MSKSLPRKVIGPLQAKAFPIFQIFFQHGPCTMHLAIMGTRGVPARYGGFETFADQLSKRFVSRGHTVTVYGRCSFKDRWGARESVNGVHRRDTPTIFHKYLETPVHAITSFIDAVPRRYDAILLCNAANSPFAFLLRARRAPLLINVDGIERNRAKWNALGRAWYRLGEWSSVAYANTVIADAEVISDYYREAYSCPTVVIPYGVHPTVRSPGETLATFGLSAGRYLLYVSRLEPENNALGVIEAYNSVRADLKAGMPLVIVGDAPYATEYKARLRETAGEGVIFAGFQFGEAYEELQSHPYLYIQATEVGGTHPALVESMSYGNCVMVNGTPENIEVVGETGVVFPKNDFKKLAVHLEDLLQRPEQVRRLGMAAAKRATDTYSWDSVVELYEQEITRLIAKRSNR